MRAEALLDVTQAALRAAFPDRADALLRVVERRLWFDPALAPEAIPAADDREIPPGAALECACCRRQRFEVGHAAMGIGGAWERFDDERYWTVHVVEGSLRLPVLLCGVCCRLAADDRAGDDAALRDLARALDAAERPDVRAELERRFDRAELPPVTTGPCLACTTRQSEPPHATPVCNECWAKARATAAARSAA